MCVVKKRKGALCGAIFVMGEDFTGNALLILEHMFTRKLWAEVEERFLGAGGFAVNAAYEANQLGPRLAVRVTVLAGVNGSELPLFFSGKRIDSLGQACSEGFQLIGRALRGAGLPQIGTQIEIFHAETIAFADRGFEVFGPREIVKLRKVAGKFGFVFTRDRDVGAVKIGQFARCQR